jgi:hypothetical protein
MVDNSTNKFWGGILQCIEGLNAFDLIGQPVALRFLYQSSAIGNHTVAVRDGAGTYSFVTNISVATANTPQMYTVLLPAIPAGASIASSTVVGMYVSVGALSAGNYKTSTLGAWQSGNYFTSGTAVNWATSGNSISLTLLQLEAGSVATPFERRSYGQELALCQRYYQLSLVNVACQAVNGTGNLQTAVTFPSMRAAPTVTLSGGTYNNTSAIYASGATTSGVSVGATVTATGEAALSSWTVTLSSEL